MKGLCWYIQSVEEGRGFVSRRILGRILRKQYKVFKHYFAEDFGYISRVSTLDEIRKAAAEQKGIPALVLAKADADKGRAKALDLKSALQRLGFLPRVGV